MVDYVALGLRIRQQRKMLKLTQEALAEKVDVSTSYIGHIERGQKRCSLETLVSIADALGVTPDLLLRDSLEVSTVVQDATVSPRTLALFNDILRVLREHEE
ncbi:MAG TPA: helix-turn-helix transcriptional regulator [Candidatus Faecivicinus avistercoris]|nr:helix-turn-helix transcriptional regulator [Candidatus Faecivicinus avistercoris]